jgi:enterochelin esterase family protein
MPRFQVTDLGEARAGISRGTVTGELKLDSKAMGYTIAYRVYTPPGYDQLERLPVLYVVDGNDFVDAGGGALPVVLDNLLADGRVKPAVAVFLDAREPANGSAPRTNRRVQEFMTRGEDYGRFIVEEVIPLVDKTYHTEPSPDARIFVGTSLGGFFGTYAAARYPDAFHNLAAFSPAYWPLANPGATGDATTAASVVKMGESIDRLLECAGTTNIACPAFPTKIFLSSGIPDWDMGDLSRIANDLKDQHYPVQFVRVQEGHSWTAWRGLMDEMLLYFLADSR